MFHKYPAPANFHYPMPQLRQSEEGGIEFQTPLGGVSISLFERGVVRLSASLGAGNEESSSLVDMGLHSVAGSIGQGKKAWTLESSGTEVRVDVVSGRVSIAQNGRAVLRSAERPFGLSGRAQIALFERPEEESPVFGLGEKTGGIDKKAQSFWFWNVDVIAEHRHNFMTDEFDPTYASIPFLIGKTGEDFFGVLIDNPGRTFVHTDLRTQEGRMFHPSIGLRDPKEAICALGSMKGRLDLYVIPGPAVRDVVRGLAALTGVSEPPPRWALGYHQCRWGYETAKQIADVACRLTKEGIPVSAIWMDIDYMDGFRVFTFDPKSFGKKQRARHFARIRENGTRIVAIVDPGVKAEPGYSVYDEGMEADLFCQTAEGQPYIGIVWPGRTVFPDFSLEEARAFWATKTAGFLAEGIDGIWIDMNDPSVGPIEYDSMRFQHGRADHEAYHNQYGDLMARATFDGFAQFDSDRRPFILTRSASTGTQKYAAVWTGDNASNETHLRMSIPQSLNLSLSGVPFNGPDVGGFCFDTTEDLLVAWNLAGFLFPFYRNHTAHGTRSQEPDAFSGEALDTIRRCIQTRAKMLPYLCEEFRLHAETGDPVMRPLFYEWPGTEYEAIEDQYLLGSHVLVAPFVDLESKTRRVLLPPGWWFALQTGKWVKGGRNIRVTRTREAVVFVRDGAILTLLASDALLPQPDFRQLEFHVFAREVTASATFQEDDGETRAYRRGEYNRFELSCEPGMELKIECPHAGYEGGAGIARVLYYGKAPSGAPKSHAEWPFRVYEVRMGTDVELR